MKKILWTRPIDPEDPFLTKVKGHIQPIHCPCYHILPLEITKIRERPDLSIVLSPHAAFALPKTLQGPILAIGPGTQHALHHRGIQSDIPKHASSEGLLLHPWFEHVKGQSIHIFCGKKGRSYVFNALEKKGAKVTIHTVYQRVMPPNLSEELPPPETLDGILATAITPITFLIQASSLDQWRHHPMYCLSPRIAKAIQTMGFLHVMVASSPTPKAMAACLIET